MTQHYLMEHLQYSFWRTSLGRDRGVNKERPLWITRWLGQHQPRTASDLSENILNSNDFSFFWKNYVAFWLVVRLGGIFPRLAWHVLHVEHTYATSFARTNGSSLYPIFLKPQLSFHTGLSLRRLQLGSPIGTETKESTKDHILVPISPLWFRGSCPYFYHFLLRP